MFSTTSISLEITDVQEFPDTEPQEDLGLEEQENKKPVSPIWVS